MAILLVAGRAGLSEYTDEVVLRPDVRAMLKKVHFGVHPEAEAAGYHKMTTILDIELADGRVISGKADFGKGSPSDPMSFDDVARKFRENTDYAKFPASQADAVIAMVRDFEKLPSIKDLMNALMRDWH